MKFIHQFLISIFLLACQNDIFRDKEIPQCLDNISDKCTLLYINKYSCISCLKKIQNKINNYKSKELFLIYTNDIELAEINSICYDTNQRILNCLEQYKILTNLSFVLEINDGKLNLINYITPGKDINF